ncbi:MAG: hypothetical protein KDA93_06270 [Planctomycetaceae bacterium]|nr:hypothetical protein [Planctomycetaceae bacterium]
MSYQDAINELWSWFSSNTKEIRTAYVNGDDQWLDEQITPRVQKINEHLNWEIGPYNDPDETFVLSPTIRENIPLTHLAISAAPRCPGWHFLAAKPPKQLRSLTFSTETGETCADEWAYQLTSYNQGEFVDIEIFMEPTADLPIEQLDMFCELVVESLVGEEFRLNRIGDITARIVDAMEAVPGLTSIQYLPDHLAAVLTPAPGQE